MKKFQMEKFVNGEKIKEELQENNDDTLKNNDLNGNKNYYVLKNKTDDLEKLKRFPFLFLELLYNFIQHKIYPLNNFKILLLLFGRKD